MKTKNLGFQFSFASNKIEIETEAAIAYVSSLSMKLIGIHYLFKF